MTFYWGEVNPKPILREECYLDRMVFQPTYQPTSTTITLSKKLTISIRRNMHMIVNLFP